MPDKKSIGTLAAKSVARVKEQSRFNGKWGVAEHLACLRYMALDALAQETGRKAKDGETLAPVQDRFNAVLQEAFKCDPELAYASNFQKLLIKAGELEAAKQTAGEAYE